MVAEGLPALRLRMEQKWQFGRIFLCYPVSSNVAIENLLYFSNERWFSDPNPSFVRCFSYQHPPFAEDFPINRLHWGFSSHVWRQRRGQPTLFAQLTSHPVMIGHGFVPNWQQFTIGELGERWAERWGYSSSQSCSRGWDWCPNFWGFVKHSSPKQPYLLEI